MSKRFRPLPELRDEQALAADPRTHASLSASAGTGKTQVLTARVLRLLLGGASPESILCLTFTKAAAAEMASAADYFRATRAATAGPAVAARGRDAGAALGAHPAAAVAEIAARVRALVDSQDG